MARKKNSTTVAADLIAFGKEFLKSSKAARNILMPHIDKLKGKQNSGRTKADKNFQRDDDIVRLRHQGKTNREIALSLGMTQKRADKTIEDAFQRRMKEIATGGRQLPPKCACGCRQFHAVGPRRPLAGQQVTLHCDECGEEQRVEVRIWLKSPPIDMPLFGAFLDHNNRMLSLIVELSERLGAPISKEEIHGENLG